MHTQETGNPNNLHGSRYVLVSAAFNEAKFIEKTIRSVTAQTVPPSAWAIVSDGSTDETDAIAKHFEERCTFIKYLRLDHKEQQAPFRFGQVAARKVAALNYAIESLATVDYEYICVIDADLSVDPPFFERMLEKFCIDPLLGMASPRIYNVFGDRLVPLSGGGALMCFRRKCFDDIGGLAPRGHEDTIAAIMARMLGWKIERFYDLSVYHHKVENYRWHRRFRAKYLLGTYDYMHGDSFIWEVLRCIKELVDTPYVIGSCFRLAGYIRGIVLRSRALSPDAVKFVHADQYRRLKSVILRAPKSV